MIGFPKRRMKPEDALHILVADFLRVALPVDSWWTTIPTGNLSRTQASLMKRKGYRPGTGDIQIIWQPDGMPYGRCYWLELKSKSGTIDGEQLNVAFTLAAMGIQTRFCRSLDDVIRALEAWGIPLRAHTEVLKMLKAKEGRTCQR